MAGYTKLFNSILASTIWREDDKTRIVWITLLAMCDKNGVAEGSIPGLADLARVSITDCEAALQKLKEPDKYSRSKEAGGRRIEDAEGGWRLINHAKYRAKMNADERRDYLRQKQKEHRAKASVNTVSTRVNNRSGSLTPSTHAEAAPYTSPKASPSPPEEGSVVPASLIQSVEDIIAAYPRQSHLLQGRAVLLDKLRAGADAATVLAGVRKIAAVVKRWKESDKRFIPSPDKFFAEERWTDDAETWRRDPDPKETTMADKQRRKAEEILENM